MLKKKNKIYLIKKNINTKQLSKKLDYKKLRLYKIKKVKKILNYKFTLLANINIY